jgi:hypothetical protein
MPATTETPQTEVHDPQILVQTRALLDTCRSPLEKQQAVLQAVSNNENWRGVERFLAQMALSLFLEVGRVM